MRYASDDSDDDNGSARDKRQPVTVTDGNREPLVEVQVCRDGGAKSTKALPRPPSPPAFQTDIAPKTPCQSEQMVTWLEMSELNEDMLPRDGTVTDVGALHGSVRSAAESVDSTLGKHTIASALRDHLIPK